MRASRASAGGQLEQPSDVNSSTTTGTRGRLERAPPASPAGAEAARVGASDLLLLCPRMIVNAAAEAAAKAATNATTKSFLVIFDPPRLVSAPRRPNAFHAFKATLTALSRIPFPSLPKLHAADPYKST